MNEKYDLPPGFKIVSGAQSGADRAGLDWAIAHSVRHGGWCPKGRRAEDGAIDPRYDLTETPSSNYLQRTEWNVRDSEVTLIFTLTDALDGGSKRTAACADAMGRAWMHFRPGVHPKFVASFLRHRAACVVNIAGKRESAAPGIHALVYSVLSQALEPSSAFRTGARIFSLEAARRRSNG